MEGDTEAQKILTNLDVSADLEPEFSLTKGDLRRDGKLYVGNSKGVRQGILQNLHNSGEGGHSGINATYKRITNILWWPKMLHDVTSWVQQCETYQRFKGEHVNLPGLLQPIPVLGQAWEVITMDFIEKLPKSEGRDTILVVIEKYTKFGHLLAFQHPFTASQVAHTLLDSIIKLYGPPSSIINDRDKIFTSLF